MSNPESPQDESTEQTEVAKPTGTHDATRPIELDEQQPAATQPAVTHAAAGTAPWPPPVPDRPTGPHAPAIVLGLVCLAVAAIVLAQEVGSLSVDWGDVGPLGIVATGAVLVLFGLAGLLSSRRKTNG